MISGGYHKKAAKTTVLAAFLVLEIIKVIFIEYTFVINYIV